MAARRRPTSTAPRRSELAADGRDAEVDAEFDVVGRIDGPVRDVPEIVNTLLCY
jgi:hypothetical protein